MASKKQPWKSRAIEKKLANKAILRYIERKIAFEREQLYPEALREARKDAEVKLINLKRKRLIQKMAKEREAELAKAIAENVQVEADHSPVDLLRDIAWVYQNGDRLFVTIGGGGRAVNPKILKTAPSAGAKWLAQYALAEPEKFIEKFAVRLIPRDAATPAEEETSKAEKRKELDPDLSGLEDFLKDGSSRTA